MTYKFTILFILMFAAYSILAQNRLIIEIAENSNPSRMIIRINSLEPLTDSINLEGLDQLVIKNKTNRQDLQVMFVHTSPPLKPVNFDSPDEIKSNDSTIFTIKDAVIAKKAFSLSRNFSITLKSTNGDVIGQKILRPKTTITSTPTPATSPIKISGIPIYDAFILNRNLNGTDDNSDTISSILAFYADKKNGLSIDTLKKYYNSNKFIADYIDSIPQLNRIRSQGDKPLKFLSSTFSSIGGLDVTSLADGAAKFLVARAKQELTIAFFDRFKRVIDSTKDIGTLFPRTADLLDAIDVEIYDYENYIQNLREAFKKDISDIHRNLPGIIDNHKDFFNSHQEIKAALLSACYTAEELENQAHPGDILANYPVEYLDSINNKNYKGAIQTVQLLSASLRDTSTQENGAYWVSIKQIRDLVNDKKVFKIYLGLIYQEAYNKFNSVQYDNTTLIQLLDSVASNYDKSYSVYNSYRSYILRFGEKADALNKMIKGYETSTTDSAIIEKYAKYFKTCVDLIEYCTETSKLPYIKGHIPDLHSLLKKYFDVAYSTSDLVIDINRKNYSSAINQAVHIYKIVAVDPSQNKDSIAQVINPLKREKALRRFNRSLGKVQKRTGKTLPENLKDAVNFALTDTAVNKKIAASNYISLYDSTKNTLSKLVRYGSFMASVATAKNSEDVQKAIEAAALPVGSSRIKRASGFNVSLNGYAGLFYGIERIKGVDSGPSKFNSFGVTAPVGIAASFGHRLFFIPTGRHEWSTSVFVSLVDLGAVAAFRFRDDSTAQVPTIQLKDIFSPGAFLSIGIPKTPLSVNLGAQVGPNLRKVSDKNDYDNNLYWRYSASICVDIPIFNLYTKSK